ncbi:transient receptor potential channel pyrexia isoform X1 [Anabrus simplex]|uniref:transient receptor potential channel pyrexia isoform X1 n=1 Tax=Anabrus simplex TaxID=316456 RepID=UPI0035A373D0
MLRDKRERSRSQTSGMRDKKRVVLDRAISMTERIPVRSSAVTYHTASPSLLKRWRNQRREGTIGFNLNLKGIADEDEESGDFSRIDYGQSPPSDEMIFFDSFEAMVPEELRVRICKESIRANLIEILRSSIGSIRTLEEIEQEKITAENVDGLSSKPQLEKNISFLWAAFLNKSELLPGLLKCGAELHSCDTDGLTALHLAAFSDDVGACKFLISRGAMVNFIKKRYTPLHCAAFGNSPSAAKLLLNNGAKIDYYKDGTSGDGTALHSAVKANSTECLQLLVESRADVNSIEPEGCSPLHLAADLGHVECLKILLNCEGIDVNVKTRDKQATALHLAAENGYSECVSLLLSKGADPAEKNSRGQTALHLAARAQSLECVEALLSVGGCDVNVLDNDLRTPLHSAVGKALQAYDVAELLIGWKSDVNAKDKYGYTPLHVAALNELSQCVETLLYHGADACARTKGGTTALSIMIRKTPAALGMVNQKLDSAISMHDPEASHREVELKLDFRHLLQHSSQGEISYLKTFVDEGQKEILQHPLCEAFLHLKWKKIRKFYIARCFFP